VKPKRQGSTQTHRRSVPVNKIELLCTQEEPSTQNATQVKAREKVPKENAGKTLPLHTHTTTKN